MWSTQSRTSAQSMKQKFFSNSFAFSVIQQMLAVWPLVPLPFLNLAVHLEVLIHMLLKPSLKNFEHSLPSMWNEWNCTVIWTFFSIAFLGIEMKINLFQSCGHCWVFQICWHIECSTFSASSFRIWNSSARIPSPLLPSYLSSNLSHLLPYYHSHVITSVPTSQSKEKQSEENFSTIPITAFIFLNASFPTYLTVTVDKLSLLT